MEILDITIAEITDPTFQPRDKLEAEGIEALAASIKEIGLINPIVVRKTDAGYELVAGTRRCHAFMVLGRDTIPAKIIEQDSREATMVQYSENFHRQDLNPIQHARMLKFMLDELGYSTAELARFCNKTREWVSRTLALLDLAPQTLEAIELGQLSPSIAQELKLIPDPALRQDYMNFAIQRGCTEKTARDWTHQAKAVIAAKDARAQAAASAPPAQPADVYTPPPPQQCALCHAPEDKVLLEPWLICWHCGQTLKPPS